MDLRTYRKSLGLSQEQCARELGVRSKSYICGIETTRRDASLRLALKIEQWSGGKVPASAVSNEAAQIARIKPGKAA